MRRARRCPFSGFTPELRLPFAPPAFGSSARRTPIPRVEAANNRRSPASRDCVKTGHAKLIASGRYFLAAWANIYFKANICLYSGGDFHEHGSHEARPASHRTGASRRRDVLRGCRGPRYVRQPRAICYIRIRWHPHPNSADCGTAGPVAVQMIGVATLNRAPPRRGSSSCGGVPYHVSGALQAEAMLDPAP